MHWTQRDPLLLGGRSWKFSRKRNSWPRTKQQNKWIWSFMFGTEVRYWALHFLAHLICHLFFTILITGTSRLAYAFHQHMFNTWFFFPTGGRILVLGMFLGLTCTIVCATFAVNVFVLFWFTITSDQSKVSIDWRDKFYKFGWDMNWASNFIGYFFVLFSWYICV